ncbi:hypothetical protein HXX76_001703 [Chlamydomonas incerta]|uniref:SRCR domain-containing protein n=1 Tax=Chlamydomonas incerta TaxID=51695 RepID=A0A836B1Y5_CHLIN|nr:hypothetical protein HXX76_001703 [Chlamydomonas incerta]|eukprot:KAG2444968.1 hypothetical protein HXX76_001703 [Chlamydomonas incerta]
MLGMMRAKWAKSRLDNSELLFRSFRLHADGSLYAEAQPWALDVSAPSGERQGSVSDAEVLRRRARHRSLQQRQQEPQRPKRPGEGSGFLKQQQQWDPDLDEGDGDQAEEQEAAGTVVNSQGGPAAARRRRRRGLLQKEDARYPVRDTGYWPNNAIVQMYFVTTGTTVGTSCSGTWVTGYDVLTATHCVYNWASNATYTSFVIRPAMSGQDWNGTYKAVFTTWYRSEWNRTNYLNEVNYYDIAMIRADANDAATTIPYPVYLGYKYDCSKSLYSASTCGYPNDRRVGDFASSASYTQMCCDFSFPGTSCQADFQPLTSCYTAPGASGSSVFDLSDYKALGVVSGRPSDETAFSRWTPLTAQHFGALERWRYQGGVAAPIPPAPPSPPPPPPLNYTRYACTSNGTVRLVSSSVAGRGRVEICAPDIGGKLWWSSVCSRGWGYPEAQVVCRQLSFTTTTAQPTQKGYFGSASSDQYFFFISNVTCVGTEASLSECKQTSWGNLDSCSSLDVAGVVCDGATGSGSTQDSVNSNPYTNDACTDWATRVNNATTYANGTVVGRIEVCINATWGTVCRRLWDDLDAAVACRALNYTFGVARRLNESWNSTEPWQVAQPSVPIWLSELNCTGAEADLSSCSQRLPYGSTQCTHGMDAGIICSNTSLTPRYSDTAQCTTLGDIRLVPLDDGSAPVNGADASGRVEICYNRRWGTICADSYWSIEEAEVLCRHLGYSYYFINTTASTGSLPVWASYTQCTGNEDKFFKCQMWGLREVTDCTSGTRAVVACSNSPTIAAPPPPASPYACSTTGALRLAPNDTSTSTYMYNDTTAGAAGGRLEFCYNGLWGTLCAEYWSTPEARVACRQLGGGLDYGGVVANGTYGFAPSAQPVWLSIANCTGKETSFAECARYSNYNYTITNTTFYPGQLGIVSLESSLYSTKTVCQSHGADLSIWCSKTWLSPPPPPSPPPPAPPPVGETCTAGDDGKLRLVTGNGTSYVYDGTSGQPQTGFLQVCYSGTWGRVCAARFGTPEAHVACRQLGFAGGAKMIYNGLVPLYVWGPAKLGPAWIDGLICSGTEALLTSCYFKGWGNLVDSCPPVQGVDAGADLVVQCLTSVNSPPPPSPPVPPVANYGCDTQGALRLVDSTGAVVDTSSATTVEGAVHVCLNSSWSYVCDYLFSSNFAATVVCKQLGFGGGTPYSWAQLAARGYTNSLVQPAGMPRGPSQLQVCYGDEPTLLDCEWTAGDTLNCPTFNSVAGVFCTRQAPPPSPPVPPPSPPPYWNQSSCTRNYDIRFQDGPNPSSGRVEVCFNGTWGPICASYWDDSLSNILCRQALGTSSAIGEAMIDWDGVAAARSSAAPNGTFPRFLFMGATYTYQLDGGFIKPFCTGSENKLSECVPVEAFGKAPGTCSRFSEVGINCWASASAKVSVPPTTAPYSCSGFTNGTVRLVNGNTPAMGRVEVGGAGVAIWRSTT